MMDNDSFDSSLLDLSFKSSDEEIDGTLTLESSSDDTSVESSSDVYDIETELSDFDNESDKHNDKFDDPLYEGSDVTTWECYLRTMYFSLRHSLTKEAVKDLLELICFFVPTKHISTVHKLKKAFLDTYEDISFSSNYCCSSCHQPFQSREDSCDKGCDTGYIDFLTIPLEAQLRRKMQGTYVVHTTCAVCSCYNYVPVCVYTDPSTWCCLKRRGRMSSHETLRDVYDGKQYQQHKEFVSKPENVTLLLNTDGVNLFRSSSTSIWPIWVILNELPPHIRYVIMIKLNIIT